MIPCICTTCGKTNEDCMTTDAYDVAMFMLKHGCPFVCPDCKEVRFNRKAIRDLIFIWPIPLPKFYVEGGVIARPETARNVEDEMYGRSDYGIVLSTGPGYWGSKKFHPTSDLPVGTKVAYDHLVPWGDFVPDIKGKDTFIVICGFGDVKGVVS